MTYRERLPSLRKKQFSDENQNYKPIHFKRKTVFYLNGFYSHMLQSNKVIFYIGVRVPLDMFLLISLKIVMKTQSEAPWTASMTSKCQWWGLHLQ